MRARLILALGCVAPAVGVYLFVPVKPVAILDVVFPSHAHVAVATAGCVIPALVLALIGRGPRVAAFLLGAVLAIDAYYGVAVAPMIPQLIVLTAFFGLGLFGFAPFWSLIANVALWRRLAASWEPADGSMARRAALGFALVLAAQVVLDVPTLVAEVAIRKGTDGGIGAKLRNRDAYRRVLLSYCYPGKRTGSPTWTQLAATAFAGPVPDVRAARTLFAKLEGKRFDAYPRPECVLCPGRGGTDNYPMPAGGPEVTEDFAAMHSRPIKLVSSRMMGTASAVGRLVTLDWTLALEGQGRVPGEKFHPSVARFHVAVPPGMALTALHVNGVKARPVPVCEPGCTREHTEMAALATREGDQLAVEVTMPWLTGGVFGRAKIELALAIAMGGTGDAELKVPFITSRNVHVLDELIHRVELGSAWEFNDAELAVETIKVPLGEYGGPPAKVTGLEPGQGFCVPRMRDPVGQVHHTAEPELPVICPVPEPGEWGLLLIGLAALAWAMRAPGARPRRA